MYLRTHLNAGLPCTGKLFSFALLGQAALLYHVSPEAQSAYAAGNWVA